MADQDEVRQRIIASVFGRRNSGGVEESYVSHLKIWEDTEDGTEKPRYILLSRPPSQHIMLAVSSSLVFIQGPTTGKASFTSPN
jgi:hypothetical protein